MYTRHQQTQKAAYTEMEVLGASPERLVPLLYEHLLVNLKRGAMQIRKGDAEGKFDSLGRAADIVCELLASLDFDAEGPLVGQLASLYRFWIQEIGAAGHSMDAPRIDRVAVMVGDLHEAWREALQTVEAKGLVAVDGLAS
ncbi:MAG: flagellar export chaperone FliS [Longimicrobiales bacterium]